MGYSQCQIIHRLDFLQSMMYNICGTTICIANGLSFVYDHVNDNHGDTSVIR